VAGKRQQNAEAIDRFIKTRVFVSKISGDQIVRTPAAADVHPGSGGTYHITIGIECVQETRFIGVSVRLKSPQRVFLYEK
jgi:hypothetical protein